MIAGAALRVSVIGQPLFADELSTYWISATHSLGGVVSLMYGTPHIPHPEITPPLYFLLAWATSQFGHAPALLRLPSLIAGVLTIPAVYLLGLRTVGRRAALLAATLTTLSPFMIYYSTEARSYGVMMLLTTLSTLAMLLAVDTRASPLVGGIRSLRVRRLLLALHVLLRAARPACVGVVGASGGPASRADRQSRRGGRGAAVAPRADQRFGLADHEDPVRAVAIHRA